MRRSKMIYALLILTVANSAFGQQAADSAAGSAPPRNNVDWVHPGQTGAFPVVVIDSGVDYTHKDLAPRMHRNQQLAPVQVGQFKVANDVFGYDFNENDLRPFDQVYVGYVPKFETIDYGDRSQPALWRFGKIAASIGKNALEVVKTIMAVGAPGHGTHVSGLVVKECGETCAIVPLKVFGANPPTMDLLEGAVAYASQRGYRLVNMSLGINGKFLENFAEDQRAAFDRVYQIMKNSPHILFVVAAGNEQVDLAESPVYPASFDLPNVIVVGATNDAGELAPFSNFDAKRIDVVAPGVDILSTWNDGGYKAVSGTSMATPIVTGRIAKHWSAHPNMSAQEAKVSFLAGIPMGEVVFREKSSPVRILSRE